MLLPVWQTIVLLGAAANADAFVMKREPLWTGLFGAGLWVVAAIGATALEPVTSSGVLAPRAELSIALLAVANAAVSLLVAIKATTGAYESATDDPTGNAPTHLNR